MFLDASAIAAVLLQESDATAYLKAMESARGKLRYSPITRTEAVLALVRKAVERRGKGPATADDYALAISLVEKLLTAIEATEVDITSSIGVEAIRALSIYGKQVGHPAQLNMGDALSYACAQACHVPLLYKGNDFSQTDLV
ncbi:type II toxin-antitoxin system VapC family toxin [Paracoccus sp. CPCC 101403]|uniref:Ribonuclease VapC n=1 Tax=Paracoccus broussonetiae TaxID=3075834 RepID=A0ABU3EL74_9RHOB|nr:type II toxin-antitoxin system VapC family toxin [Paracoccus sp. CPCC 101403]MDT1064190.1 type II toxin-antitoxin system VapC family toxin [Paracoccus sp. CPCC 101403]